MSFNSKISPLTSTVIFLDKSPFATAFVTSAIFRTWAVKFPAIKFTLSVKSLQVPATPLTSACPPNLPSVPTSRATRITSEANEFNCATIVLTICPVWRNSPLSKLPSISNAMVWERSPLATARITRDVSAIGWTKSVIRVLTDSMQSVQEPPAFPNEAR